MLHLGDDRRPHWIQRLDTWHLLTPARVVLILLVAVVLSVVVKRVVRRVLGRTLHLAGRFGPSDPRSEVRGRALASALRSGLVGVIWTVAVITAVSEAGINIGAFVATATVVGGAIGFGAQTLIRDVIGGFFVLAEDQYGTGDIVDLGHALGTVEKVTLRSVRVRDGEGRVWFVPHGNVVRVANLSRSSQAVLNVEVDRASDHAEVLAALDALCAELAADQNVGTLVVGEPSAAGPIEMRDDRVIYQLVAGTRPGEQDGVRRRWRVAVLAAFADGRLTAPPRPTTTVVLAPGQPGLPPSVMP